MKKSIAILMTFFLLFATCAQAATNIRDISDEELISLYEKVTKEMKRRNLMSGEAITLREGQYIIGEDIPAGKYTIACTEVEDTYGDFASSMSGIAGLLGEEEGKAYSDYFNALGKLAGEPTVTVKIVGAFGAVKKTFEMKKGDTQTITLEEGTAIQISSGSCTLTEK